MTEEPLPPYGSPDPAPEAGSRSGVEPAAQPGPAPTPVSVPRNEQHFTVLGGLRRSGRWSVPRQTTVASLIGGVDLDLRVADLPPGEVVLQHFSLIGGVSLVVPAHVAVRVEGLRLIGGQSVEDAAGPTTTTLVIRSFGILGGVRVQRS